MTGFYDDVDERVHRQVNIRKCACVLAALLVKIGVT